MISHDHGRFSFLGAAAGLMPLTDASGNQVLASDGTPEYVDANGNIVDANGNSINPLAALGIAQPSPSSSSPAWSLSGSTLRYQASWTVTDPIDFVASIGSASAVIAALATKLQGFSMSVLKTNSASNGPFNYSIDINILDSIGHAAQSDVLGIVQNIVLAQLGHYASLTGSTVSLVSAPGSGSPATPSVPAAGASQSWLSNLFSGSPASASSSIPTWEWVAIAGVGVVALIVVAGAVSRR